MPYRPWARRRRYIHSRAHPPPPPPPPSPPPPPPPPPHHHHHHHHHHRICQVVLTSGLWCLQLADSQQAMKAATEQLRLLQEKVKSSQVSHIHGSRSVSDGHGKSNKSIASTLHRANTRSLEA
eukprot:2961584-Rhodomonas_salina.2